ncbi:MAG: NAD(+)/NADH kinase [Bacteroidales bacterium]|nr:NAD(+)/NADH kinase [Bacteroidales bacterium]
MKLALYIRHTELWEDARYRRLEKALESLGKGFSFYRLGLNSLPEDGTDMVLAVGGDGTFLSAASVVAESGVPLLGINLGRIGFLSENSPQDALSCLASGRYALEDRSLLHVAIAGTCCQAGPQAGLPSVAWPYALNEVAVLRKGAAMLGVEVRVDGIRLPTYWADGLLIATSSGSTAYSLSVGGPIVMPESKVWILSPVAPHNLNVRPLVIPDSSTLDITFQSRDEAVSLSLDNRLYTLSPQASLHISMAEFSLKRVRLAGSNFIGALTDKLYWGEDLRNGRKDPEESEDEI